MHATSQGSYAELPSPTAQAAAKATQELVSGLGEYMSMKRQGFGYKIRDRDVPESLYDRMDRRGRQTQAVHRPH